MRTYQNPVYAQPCADPFVLKYCGEYWCYFTGIQPDGGCFGILHSPDLVHWEPVGSALQRLPAGSLPYPDTCYWAPEVVYENGWFYLYYSVGDEVHMQIRVAVARQPQGPFRDSGQRVTREQFAIDAHVFVDEDGQRYLFYATDYLDHPRVGTGTAMARLLDPFTLAGESKPVTRARYDWQIYDPQRQEKEGVCWHTLEGPCVLKHEGLYYQMFSGGNWHNASYGVAYGITHSLDEGEWEQPVDGEKVFPLLRSIPEKGVMGPGHNSVVRGPDNRTLYCAYHRWRAEPHERVLAIDRLGWEGERLVVAGPSAEEQPAPPWPQVDGFEQFCATQGVWQLEKPRALCVTGPGQAVRDLPESDFVLEVSLRSLGTTHDGYFGLSLSNEDVSCEMMIALDQGEAHLRVAGQSLACAPDFDACAFHLLRVVFGDGVLRVIVDDYAAAWEGSLSWQPKQVRLDTSQGLVEFVGLAIG